MRVDLIVLPPRVFNVDPGFPQRKGDFTVEWLIKKRRVETLSVVVLAGSTLFDLSCPGPNDRRPFLHSGGAELQAVIRPEITRRAPQDKLVGPCVDHSSRVELAVDRHRQTLLTPEPFKPIEVDHPAGLPQQRSDAPIALAVVLARQQ